MIRLMVLISSAFMVSKRLSRVTRLGAGQAGLALARFAFFGDGAGAIHVVQHVEFVAGLGQCAEAADDDRRAGAGLWNHLAAVVEEAADAAEAGAGQTDIADLQRAILHQHGGDRAEAFVHLAFDDGAARRGGRVGLEFHDLALEIEDFDQFRNALAGGGAGADDFGVAAPFDGVEAFLGELAEHHVRVGIGAVDLVHRHDDRHAGGPGVIDRFDRLRLNAFGGGDDQHDDIGHVRAAGAHGGEGLVAGRVDEGDALGGRVATIQAAVCWVMPPASPAATLALRILSSRDVLPWSTWPRIVTTGGPQLKIGRDPARALRSRRPGLLPASPAGRCCSSMPNSRASVSAVS